MTLINHGDDPVEVAIEGTDAETGAVVERVALESQGVAFVVAPSRRTAPRALETVPVAAT